MAEKLRSSSRSTNSVGAYYNKYMDTTFKLPHIDYRKDSTAIDNNNYIKFPKKNSKSYDSQVTGKYQYVDNMNFDKNNYGNDQAVLIRPKPNINVLGLQLHN